MGQVFITADERIKIKELELQSQELLVQSQERLQALALKFKHEENIEIIKQKNQKSDCLTLFDQNTIRMIPGLRFKNIRLLCMVSF